MKLTLKERVEQFIGDVRYHPVAERPAYVFKFDAERQLLQGEHWSEGRWWHTRKWYISEHATDSEIIQTFLKCAITSAEHEAREHFFYRGRTIYGPHMDKNELWEAATNKDERPPFMIEK